MARETDCDLDKKTSLTSDAEMRPEPPALCVNPGNPVFSCMLDPKTLHTATSLSKAQMIMYKTSASQYGAFSPRPFFFPCKFLPQEQAFTEHLKTTGFYQNNSLNVGPDRTRTIDSPNYQHTLWKYILLTMEEKMSWGYKFLSLEQLILSIWNLITFNKEDTNEYSQNTFFVFFFLFFFCFFFFSRQGFSV